MQEMLQYSCDVLIILFRMCACDKLKKLATNKNTAPIQRFTHVSEVYVLVPMSADITCQLLSKNTVASDLIHSTESRRPFSWRQGQSHFISHTCNTDAPSIRIPADLLWLTVLFPVQIFNTGIYYQTSFTKVVKYHWMKTEHLSTK